MVSPGKPRGWTGYCSTRTMKKASPSVLKSGYTRAVTVRILRVRYASWAHRTQAAVEECAVLTSIASRALTDSGLADCELDRRTSRQVLLAEVASY